MAESKPRPTAEIREAAREAINPEQAEEAIRRAADIEPEPDAKNAIREAAAQELAEIARDAAERARRRARKPRAEDVARAAEEREERRERRRREE